MIKKLRISVEGKSYDVEVEMLDEVGAPPPARSTGGGNRGSRVSAPATAPAAPVASSSAGGDGEVTSPLGAVVVSLDVAVGDTVTEGQKVMTLEAMKMNTIVNAPGAGKVAAIHVKAGDGVEEGQKLLTIA